HGLEPIRSGISGTIKYIGKWPANTAEVRIVAATKFPPTDINDLIIGDILPLGGDSTDYSFYLEPGDYYLGIVWREREAPWGIQSIFGIYTAPDNAFTPAVITVPDDTTMVTGKDIIADFSYAKKASNSSISGTITFIGNWPENVENVMVIGSTQFPPESLLDFAFSSLLPAYVDSADYFIQAVPDTYKAIGAIIKIADQSWALENIIGLLLKPNSLELQEVIVPDENSQVQDVDLIVYFRSQ
ncbi:MAG: hypothetical protein JSW07_04705, partial [bacterium]